MINEIKNQNLNKVYPQNDSKIGALNGFPSTAVKRKSIFINTYTKVKPINTFNFRFLHEAKY